jgi:hypothetical protein
LLIFLLLGADNDRHSQDKDSLKQGDELQTAATWNVQNCDMPETWSSTAYLLNAKGSEMR